MRNTVACLPGQRSGDKAILVPAHYELQPHTLSASDDGASVAAMLETILTLRTDTPLDHDVIWLPMANTR